MGFVTYDGQWRTLQTSFDFSFPQYQVSGQEFPQFGYDSWIVVEQSFGNDNRLRPGEDVIVTGFNTFTDSADTANAKVYTYEGLVDLNNDGWLDSAVISRFSAEYISIRLKSVHRFPTVLNAGNIEQGFVERYTVQPFATSTGRTRVQPHRWNSQS